MKNSDKIFVAGARGLVGSAITRNLKTNGFHNLLLPSHAELELTDRAALTRFYEKEKPDYVFLAAAKVGGIHANSTYPVDFLVSNLQIQLNVIELAHQFKVKRLMFLGSSCIYPRLETPLKETDLLTGPLEPTNRPYAIAKIAGIELCKSYNKQFNTDYISVMPTNLYGLNDNYHPQNSHVIPGMIRRFHEAKIRNDKVVSIWGSGTPLREFLFSDDLAEACVYLMQNYRESEIVNIGSAQEVTIRDLAILVQKVVGFKGDIIFDKSQPDGTPRKLLDSSRLMQMGWRPKVGMADGLQIAYKDFVENHT